MALEQITFNIGALEDLLAGGKNYVAGQVYQVFNTNDTLASIFSDAAGTIPILQDGISNVSNTDGEVNFYIAVGDYYFTVGGKRRDFEAGLGIKLINDLSQAYWFDTFALMRDSDILFPDNKTLKTREYRVDGGGGAEYTKIAGTGTANGLTITASTVTDSSFVIRADGVADLLQLGADKTGATETQTLLRDIAGDTALSTVDFGDGNTFLFTEGVRFLSRVGLTLIGRNTILLTIGTYFEATAKSNIILIEDSDRVLVEGLTFQGSFNDGVTGWLDASTDPTNADVYPGTTEASDGLAIINSSNVIVRGNRFDSLEVGMRASRMPVGTTWTPSNNNQASNILVGGNTFFNNRQHFTRTYGSMKGVKFVNNSLEYGIVKFSDSGGLGSEGLVVDGNNFVDLMVMFIEGKGISITNNTFDNFQVAHYFFPGSTFPNETGNASYDIEDLIIAGNNYIYSGGIKAFNGVSFEQLDPRNIMLFGALASNLPVGLVPTNSGITFKTNNIDIESNLLNTTLGFVVEDERVDTAINISNFFVDDNFIRYTNSLSTFRLYNLTSGFVDVFGEISFSDNRVVRGQVADVPMVAVNSTNLNITSIFVADRNTGNFASGGRIFEIYNINKFVAHGNELNVNASANSTNGTFDLLVNQFDIQDNIINRGSIGTAGRLLVLGRGTYVPAIFDDFFGVLKRNTLTSGDGMFKFDVGTVPSTCKGFIDADSGHVKSNNAARWYLFTTGLTNNVVFTLTDATAPPANATTNPVWLQDGIVIDSFSGTSGQPIGWVVIGGAFVSRGTF